MIDPLFGEVAASASTRVLLGDVVDSGGALVARLGGVPQSARWNQGYYPAAGDAVAVLVTAGATGQSSNLVLCKVGAGPAILPPAEALVTAAPAASPTITVSSEGASFEAKVAYPSPAIGDLVLLTWRGSVAYAISLIGATAPPEPPPPIEGPQPPPGGATSGTLTAPAIDSGTYQVGAGWNDRTFGSDVIQGSYGGRTSTGSWFYGTTPSSIAGRPLAASRIYLGPRRRMGNYNAAATLHLYAHNAPSRPGGEPTRTVGPFDISLPAGFAGGWLDVPISTGIPAAVIAGGGVSIAGNPYAGVVGRLGDPQSGAFAFDWTS